MKRLSLFLMLVILVSVARAQINLSPDIVAANGGFSKFREIELEWTLGEAVIGNAATSLSLYTAGFHQPVLVSRKVEGASAAGIAGVRVYPNPTEKVLIVQIPLSDQPVRMILSDLSGHVLIEKSVSGKAGTAVLNMQSLTSGVYLLRVLPGGSQPSGLFKIIKAN